jgi:nickel transport protein
MRNTKLLFGAAVLVGTMLVTATAGAHGIWFAERSDQLAVVYGVGADDLDIVKRLPKITSIKAYDIMQEPLETSLSASQYLVVVDTSSHPAIVAAILDNGLWSKTPEGEWLPAGRDEVPNAVIAEHTIKFAVHLRAPLVDPLNPIPGQALQILPDDAILPDKMGAELPLRVMYKGEPAAGARIIVDFVNDPDAERIITGSDGRATIRIRNQGLNVIGALYDSPPEDPDKIDKVENMATLSFVLPHEPE